MDQLKDRVAFGAFAANEPWPGVQSHYDLEASLGVRLNIMSWFMEFGTSWLSKQAAQAASTGHDLLICWQPSRASGAPVRFSDILAGAYDGYLDTFFAKAAAYPYDVIIRFAHEMNGNWYPWSMTSADPCAKSLDEWLATWRYIVDRQRRTTATNVKWMWCTSSVDVGSFRAESYWPGADYVDILSMDAYNGYTPWTSAKKLIQPMYDRLAVLDPAAPIWIAELGCRANLPGDTVTKAQWFGELFGLTVFPRLSAIVFFNMLKDPAHDWRLTTSDVRPVVSSMLQGARDIAR